MVTTIHGWCCDILGAPVSAVPSIIECHLMMGSRAETVRKEAAGRYSGITRGTCQKLQARASGDELNSG
jgi:hypothetical protein